jgi:hypothetical protein
MRSIATAVWEKIWVLAFAAAALRLVSFAALAGAARSHDASIPTVIWNTATAVVAIVVCFAAGRTAVSRRQLQRR